MNSVSYAIRIIPDLTIDDKYAAIIGEAQSRIQAFTANAVRDNRIPELYFLEKSKLTLDKADTALRSAGKLIVGFQFEVRPEAPDDNFRLYAKKLVDAGQAVKFHLTPTVQQIMLQLISLEDRRTVAIFSMLNSSMEVGYRILTTLYANQLRRLVDRTDPLIRPAMRAKLEKLTLSKSMDDPDIWKDEESPAQVSGLPRGDRPGAQDNLLQVLADDGAFNELNQYVGDIITKSDRIREKRHMLERNSDMSKHEIYEQMIREDFEQLENCYARMHIYLKAFYKNKDRRPSVQNRVLRQFFAGEIERITGETSLLEDLLCLGHDDYFKNISRHPG